MGRHSAPHPAPMPPGRAPIPGPRPNKGVLQRPHSWTLLPPHPPSAGPLHAAGLTKAIELAGGSIVTRSLPGACLVSLQNDLEFLSKAWVCGAGMARR